MATLTAPIRWLGGAFRGAVGLGPTAPPTVGRFRRRPPWPDEEGRGGVREPRRPKRTPPAGAMALTEPTGTESTDASRGI